MLYSIFQIMVFQALFLLVYDLFLKRETFFNCNRAYLMITSILSVVLPFVKFPELKTMATKDMVIHLPEVFIGTKTPSISDIQIAEQAGIILEQPQTPIWQIIIVTGIAIATLIFLIKIAGLYYTKHKNPKRWQGNVLVISLIKSSAAYSFFNMIFLGERISETAKPTIYKHELVHIKEYHTIDLLVFELLRIVFWFNPMVYLFQNRIKELHEYVADAKASKQSGKADYYTSLLNQVLDVNQVSITNTFFKKSLIKKRIAMLQKSKSKQLNLIKYALLIPMVFGMLIYTSTDIRALQKVDSQDTFIDQELTDAELIKKYYNKMVTMKKNGATFFQISDYAGINTYDPGKYLLSRTEFLKLKAHGQLISDGIIQRKSEEGSPIQKDINTVSLTQLDKFENYDDFKAFKSTKAEKERWESNTQDGVLKLYVEDVGNKTPEETKRFNALIKQLENDDSEKLVISSNSSTIIIDSPNTQNREIHILKNEVQRVEVPFSVVEKTPTTIECKDLESNKDRKNCFITFVHKHIGKNFNVAVGDSLSPGRKRIFVQFKIDTDGTVKDIKARGPSPELEVEARRVVATLPKFIPGKQKGKLVVVPFSVPIVFEVKGDKIENRVSDQKYHVNLEKREETELEPNLTDIPYSKVEVTPIYPDCNSVKSEIERKDCTVQAINKFVGKNFNIEIGKSLGLPSKKTRIFTSFLIDKHGEVTHISARGPHPKLEEEAVRVLKLLPQFIPGEQDGKAVNVQYAMPIVFEF
ncbi:M56 family metallopeptidase [Winogradskyella bathintestinalis]|uniref:M56 family metallopeptidase n=1 Tax=Winogradskyella bathintestinalis TaxID=3035208 RepID=A0ABT7ZQI4_9FLAO|nr:M56 family metallopeptidase [Winogradskyella bathintestinalis]MDN3491265.1 M56 family metallopeptidase [Winogradskyella bathintestinalis]